MIIFGQIELNEILSGGERFHNRCLVFSGQGETSCPGSLASGLEQASPSAVEFVDRAKEKAFDGPSCRALPQEARLEDRDVVSENTEVGRQEVGEFVKMMMEKLSLLSSVDKQTGTVSSISWRLSDSIGGKFEVQF